MMIRHPKSSRLAVPSAPTLRSAGFTLVELAIVMFIIALLLGGMLMPLSAQQDVRARQETEQRLAEIREALYGFALLNGRLPQPASAGGSGAEDASTCGSVSCVGYVPWATLGTARTDSWGKLFRYTVSKEFVATITTAAVPKLTVQPDSVGGSYLAGGTTCSTTSQCVPAVFFSQGKNNYGTTENGALLSNTSSTNVDETGNDTLSADRTAYYSRTPSENATAPGGEFDDLVLWLSSNTLFNRLINAGKL